MGISNTDNSVYGVSATNPRTTRIFIVRTREFFSKSCQASECNTKLTDNSNIGRPVCPRDTNTSNVIIIIIIIIQIVAIMILYTSGHKPQTVATLRARGPAASCSRPPSLASTTWPRLIIIISSSSSSMYYMPYIAYHMLLSLPLALPLSLYIHIYIQTYTHTYIHT